MKRTFTIAALRRLSDAELRSLFRMVASLSAVEPDGSVEKGRCLTALKAIGWEISRRRSAGPKPGAGP